MAILNTLHGSTWRTTRVTRRTRGLRPRMRGTLSGIGIGAGSYSGDRLRRR